MNMFECPCGGKLYAACCGRFLDGGERAPSAEQLMRSRYSAFALGNEGRQVNRRLEPYRAERRPPRQSPRPRRVQAVDERHPRCWDFLSGGRDAVSERECLEQPPDRPGVARQTLRPDERPDRHGLTLFNHGRGELRTCPNTFGPRRVGHLLLLSDKSLFPD